MSTLKDNRHNLMIDPSACVRLVIEPNADTGGIELYFDCFNCSKPFFSNEESNLYVCPECQYEITKPELETYLSKVTGFFIKLTQPQKKVEDVKKSIWHSLMFWKKRP